MENFKVFVYGTLRQVMHNHYLLETSKQLHHGDSLAHLYGYKMYSAGGFPFIIPTGKPNDIVLGELYECTPATMARLDRLEGYINGDDENSWYRRREESITYRDPGSGYLMETQAWVYYWNIEDVKKSRGEVTKGDWVSYVQNR